MAENSELILISLGLVEKSKDIPVPGINCLKATPDSVLFTVKTGVAPVVISFWPTKVAGVSSRAIKVNFSPSPSEL